ncbi:MAG: hypothetical protein ACRD2C_11300 [Acidimicrobiales bacterium]
MTDRALRVFAAVTAIALLALAGCGGSDDDGAASAAPDGDVGSASEAASPDADAEALVFAECMRSNGVDMPDPAPDQDGFFDAFHSVVGQYDDTTLQNAIAACEDFFPTYAGAAHGGDDEAVLALAECLREQGLDVPDNLFEDGALLDIDQDELRPAMEACRDVLSGADQ